MFLIFRKPHVGISDVKEVIFDKWVTIKILQNPWGFGKNDAINKKNPAIFKHPSTWRVIPVSK